MIRILILSLLLSVIACEKEIDNPISNLKIPQQWNNRAGKYAELPAFINVNKGLKKLNLEELLPFQGAISVKFNYPQENGLPSDREMAKLNKIRDQINNNIVVPQIAIHALEITTDKRCDFILYGYDKKLLNNSLKKIKENITVFETEISVKKDNKWITYNWFVR